MKDGEETSTGIDTKAEKERSKESKVCDKIEVLLHASDLTFWQVIAILDVAKTKTHLRATGLAR